MVSKMLVNCNFEGYLLWAFSIQIGMVVFGGKIQKLDLPENLDLPIVLVALNIPGESYRIRSLPKTRMPLST